MVPQLTEQQRTRRRRALVASVVISVGAIAGWLTIGPWFIALGLDGKLGPLSGILRSHQAVEPAVRQLPYYEALLGRATWAIVELCVLGGLALVALATPRRSLALARGWILALDSALNLAIARVAVCGALLFALGAYGGQMEFVSDAIPASARAPAVGSGWLLAILPPSADAFAAVFPVTVACFALAFVGLGTRAALPLGVLGFLWLGAGFMSAGVVHNRWSFATWSALALAFAPCADTLSLDSLRRSFRRADRGDTAPPEDSPAYGAPLRLIWILMAVSYFFPGFFKLGFSGPAWFTGEQLTGLIRGQWMILPEFRRSIPIDQWTALHAVLGWATLVFELFFVLALVHRLSRALLAVVGLGFHMGIWFAMGIRFTEHKLCYPVLIDWSALARWVGERRFTAALVVAYDGHCMLCRRSVAAVRLFDWTGRIRWVRGEDAEGLAAAGFTDFDEDAFARAMQAASGPERFEGYAAVLQILRRLPLAAPFVPLLASGPLVAVGTRIYARVAASRTCRPVEVLPARPAPRPLPRLAIAVGLIVLAGNLLLGFTRTRGFPLSCMPTFDSPQPGHIRLRALDLKVDGSTAPVDEQVMRAGLGSFAWLGLARAATTELEAGQAGRVAERMVAELRARGQVPAAGGVLRLYEEVWSGVHTDDPKQERRRYLFEYDLERGTVVVP